MRLIDAEELTRLFNAQIEQGATDAFDAFDDALQDALTIDAVPVVHGRWIERDDDWFATYYDCSVCGESWVPIDGTPEQNNVKYCPSCGAKMDGGEAT